MKKSTKMSLKKLPLALGLTVLAGSSTGYAGITIGESDGWKADLTGRVNAYLLHNAPRDTAEYKTARIRTGFNPSQLGVNVMAPKWNGYDVNARIAMYPSIQNSNQKFGEPALQLRESFFTLAKEGGTWTFGRTLSTYQRQQVIADMSGLGVGATNEYSTGNSTTAGMITYGYLYTNFNSGITYKTADMGGLTFTAGLYDPSYIGDGGNTKIVENPRFEFETVYDVAFSSASSLKVYVSGLWQDATFSTAVGTKSVGDKIESKALSGGLGFTMSKTRLNVSAYSGEAVGIAGNLSGSDALDSDGNATKSNGYHVQIVQGFGMYDIGFAHGQSRVQKLENTGEQILLVYHASDYLKFTAEAGYFKDMNDEVIVSEYNSYNVGATLMF